MTKVPKRVLISVTDKSGIVEFAHGLEQLGYEIISTGGTAKALRQGEIKVREVEDLTGYPEILDGRGEDPSPQSVRGTSGRARQRTAPKRDGRARHPAD